MIEWTDELKKQFRMVTLLGFVILVIAPIIYIVVVLFLKVQPQLEVSSVHDMVLYILLFLAMTQPIIIPLLEKFQISIYKKNPKTNFLNIEKQKMSFLAQPKQGSPMALFTTMTIIKSAIIESIYIYGFVNYMITGDFMRMLYFYPIGIAWTLVYFPTKERCENFLEKVSSNEPV